MCSGLAIIEEGAMKTALQSNVSSLVIGRRLTGLAVTALFASTLTMMAAKPASAFDIGGLIGTAMALQMGGHYGSSHHHSREQVASRHERASTSRGSGGDERDARDADAPAPTAKPESKIAARQQSFGPDGNTTQASERDASAAPVVTAGMKSEDTPPFSPSR
jgi:hypothetical protein